MRIKCKDLSISLFHPRMPKEKGVKTYNLNWKYHLKKEIQYICDTSNKKSDLFCFSMKDSLCLLSLQEISKQFILIKLFKAKFLF